MILYLISLFEKYIRPIYTTNKIKQSTGLADIESQLIDNKSYNNKVHYLEGNPIYIDDDSSSLISNNYER